MIWHLDQVPGSGIEQVREWYTEFPVKASAAPRCPTQRRLWASSAGCVERCPFDVEIIAKMREAATLFEGQAA